MDKITHIKHLCRYVIISTLVLYHDVGRRQHFVKSHNLYMMTLPALALQSVNKCAHIKHFLVNNHIPLVLGMDNIEIRQKPYNKLTGCGGRGGTASSRRQTGL